MAKRKIDPDIAPGEYIPCHVCRRPAVTYHEPLMGNKYRQLSIDYDLRIPVCEICHDMFHKKPETNEPYQIEMQEKFEASQDFETWMEIFGRNYR